MLRNDSVRTPRTRLVTQAVAFAVPMIISQLFMNVNFIVDGLFVAHAVGTDGLSAINIVMPFIPLTIVLATMLGTGGSAFIRKKRKIYGYLS